MAAYVRSLRRRNDEFGAFLEAGWPARGHCLCLSVKAHRVGPALVQVAEPRALPAAERVIRELHRNRQVHAHHADVHYGGVIAVWIVIAGANGRALPVL